MKKHLIIAVLIALGTSHLWGKCKLGVTKTVDETTGHVIYSNGSQSCWQSIENGKKKCTCTGTGPGTVKASGFEGSHEYITANQIFTVLAGQCSN